MVEVSSLSHTPLQISFMVRTLHSLSSSQIDEVTRALKTCGPMWAVDQYADYDGDVSVMAMHEQTGATFTITGAAGQVDVHQIRGDELRHSGRFDSTKHAAAFMTNLLAVSA